MARRKSLPDDPMDAFLGSGASTASSPSAPSRAKKRKGKAPAKKATTSSAGQGRAAKKVARKTASAPGSAARLGKSDQPIQRSDGIEVRGWAGNLPVELLDYLREYAFKNRLRGIGHAIEQIVDEHRQ